MFFVADEKSLPRIAYGPFYQVLEAAAFIQGFEAASNCKMPNLIIYQVKEEHE